MGKLLNSLVKIISFYRLRIPPDFYLLTKALVTIEGVGREIDPDFDMVKHVEPFAKKIIEGETESSQTDKKYVFISYRTCLFTT